MPETRDENGGTTLRFGPPRPPKGQWPTSFGSELKIVAQSSSYAHSKAFDETNRLQMSRNALFPILLEIFTVNRTTRTAILFFFRFVKIVVVEYCEYHRFVALVKRFRMSTR